MDWELIQKLLAIVAALAAFWRYLEVRIMSVRTEFFNRLDDRNKINEIVQQSLKEDIGRLESKIDMLISLQISQAREQARKGEHDGSSS